jgi:hypothetical protein
MSSSSGTKGSDLVQTVYSGRKVQEAVRGLMGYLDIDTIVVEAAICALAALCDSRRFILKDSLNTSRES